ncbi:MAG: hypothetical protein R3E04_04135 [Sphingobium sp.]
MHSTVTVPLDVTGVGEKGSYDPSAIPLALAVQEHSDRVLHAAKAGAGIADTHSAIANLDKAVRMV